MPELWDEFDRLQQDSARTERGRRRDQEAAEAEAIQLHLASRTLQRVLWEAMNQGRSVVVSWPGGSAGGRVVSAIGDLAVVAGPDRQYAIQIPRVEAIEVESSSVAEGTSGDREVATFAAWLRMAEGQEVAVHTTSGATRGGVMVAVTPDHVLVRLRSGGDVAVALARVAAVSVVGEIFPG